MPTPRLSDDLNSARKRALSLLAAPPAMPVIKDISDYHGLLATSEALERAFAQDLRTLARAGDLASIQAFINAELIPLEIWNRLPGSWLPSIFEAASFELLEPLTRQWISPALRYPYENTFCHSAHWGLCLSVAISRAQGSSSLLTACEELLPLGIHHDYAAGETINAFLGRSLPRAAPEDFERLLRASQDLISAQDSSHLPTFFSRLSGSFQEAYDQVRALAQSDADQARESQERLDLQADVFLRWAAQIDLRDSSYPMQTRLLKNSAIFCQRPALAPALAGLWIQNQGASGFVFDLKEIIAADPAALGERYDKEKGIYPWNWRDHLNTRWTPAQLGPIEQALFHGAPESARAMIQAGASWDHEAFKSVCEIFHTPPTPLSERAARAWSLSERLVLETRELTPVVSEAPKPPSSSPRL